MLLLLVSHVDLFSYIILACYVFLNCSGMTL